MAGKNSILCSTKEDIWMAVRRRGSQIAANMTDQDFFESDSFRNYAGKLAAFILRNGKRKHRLSMKYQPSDKAVAYTDGEMIYLNTGNPIAAGPKLLERRFRANMGILFHECAHKLFLDFTLTEKAITSIRNGSLYGKVETYGNPALEDAKAELEKLLSQGYRESIAQLFGHLCNILDDGHDEAAMKKAFPGFVADCIDAANSAQIAVSPTIEQLIEDRVPTHAILIDCALMYAKWGFYNTGKATDDVKAVLKKMAMVEPTIEAAVSEHDCRKRWGYLNTLVLQMWPDIRQMFQKQDSGNGNGSGGSAPQGSAQQASGASASGAGSQSQQGGGGESQPTPEQIAQGIQDMMNAIAAAMNAAPAPVNEKGKGIKPSAITGEIPPTGDCASICGEIGEEKAKKEVQAILDKAQMDAIRNTNQPLIHKRTKLHVNRNSEQDKLAYDEIYQEVAPYVRNLVMEMKSLLRELNSEAVIRHKSYGPIIEAGESFRLDGRFFAKKKLPDDLPDMAICLLLDGSGSMHGDKILHCKRTAILIERYASELNIPIMVASHDVTGGVNLRIHTDFVSTKPEADRYTLGAITAGGCNRDGLPLRACLEILSKRPERVKLLVSVSDGAPNDTGYRGEEARKDISEAVQAYRRKGILIYGAAIDEDREVIEKIYGNGFLSIENLASLPKALVRLMRRELLG